VWGSVADWAAAGGCYAVFSELLNHYEADDLMTLDQAAELIPRIECRPILKLLADTYHMNIEEVDIAARPASQTPPCWATCTEWTATGRSRSRTYDMARFCRPSL